MSCVTQLNKRESLFGQEEIAWRDEKKEDTILVKQETQFELHFCQIERN